MRAHCWQLIVAFLALSLFVGCGEYEANIRSDTEWSGAFSIDGAITTIDGRGNDRIPMGKESSACCTVQKQTEFGNLRVKIENTGWLGSDGDEGSTSAEYGVVSVCSD